MRFEIREEYKELLSHVHVAIGTNEESASEHASLSAGNSLGVEKLFEMDVPPPLDGISIPTRTRRRLPTAYGPSEYWRKCWRRWQTSRA